MRKFVFIFYLILFAARLQAQTTSSTGLAEPEKLFSERIFIHTDKSVFIAGDTIWFKAYLFNGNYPGSATTDFYIDLVNEAGNIINSKKLPVIDGTVFGNFALPDSLEHGFYFLRAYDHILLSQGNKNGVIKAVAVINPDKIPPKYHFDQVPEYRVEFFPESGSIVDGFVNSIIFKATDQFDHGLNIQGFLFNAAGDTIVSFKDIDKGIGVFSFTPAGNENYHAEIIFNARTKKKIDLPATKKEGVLLKVAENLRGKIFQVQKTETITGSRNELELTGFMFNQIVFRETLKFNENTANGVIPVNNLPAGILHLIVTGKDKITYAARSVFIYQPGIMIPVSFKTDTLSFLSKAKNSFTLSFPDSVEGNFSVSVIAYDDRSDILDNNNITGTVFYDNEKEVPVSVKSYDIGNPDKQTRSINDLMLVIENKKPAEEANNTAKQIKENYIEISGEVFKEGTNKRIIDGELIFLIQTKDSAVAFERAVVQKDGTFILDNLVFDDSAKFNYQLGGAKSTPIDIKLNKPVERCVIKNNIPHFSFLPADKLVFRDSYELKLWSHQKKSLVDAAKGKVMEEVKVTSRLKRPVDILNKKYTHGLFSNMINAKVYDFINDPPKVGSQNIFDYLQGKVAGLRITKKDGNYYLASTRMASAINGPGISVQLFLNEAPVETNILVTVPVNQIALVKFFQLGTNMMEGFGLGARLAIYTKNPEDINWGNITNSKAFYYPGYDAVQDFTNKDYSDKNLTAKDDRTTLYWNPHAGIFPGDNEFKIRFYNADTVKKFKIVVQGFASDGRLIHLEKIVQ